MHRDPYTRFVLTVIAGCLIALVLRSSSSDVGAQTTLKCTGQLKANAWGGSEPSIGGYSIDLNCK
jgi:hypothetical protein